MRLYLLSLLFISIGLFNLSICEEEVEDDDDDSTVEVEEEPPAVEKVSDQSYFCYLFVYSIIMKYCLTCTTKNQSDG